MQRPLAACPQCHRAAIERDLIRGLDLIGEVPFDIFQRYPRRQQNAPLGGGARQFADRDIRRARQRRGRIDRRAPSIGEHEAAIAAITRDAIGKRQSEHHADGRFFLRRRNDRAGLFTRSHLRGPTLRLAARASGALRAVAAELIEPDVEIDIVAAEATLGDDSGNLRGFLARAQTM